MVDITNPTISIVSPLPNSKNNDINSVIVFTLNDAAETGSGIDGYGTLTVTINGDYAFHDGYIQSGFDGYFFDNPDQNNVEVHVRRLLPYQSLESVNISIDVKDLSGNPSAASVYSFISIDDVPPSITNIVPTNHTGQVPSDQIISFSLRTTPRETSIDINTLTVLISGFVVDAYGILVLDGYGNPIVVPFIEPDMFGQLTFDQRQVSITQDTDGLGYSINIIPLSPLPLSARIVLDISVQDVAGNLATSITSFTTSDDAAPVLLFPLPTPSSIANSIAATISFTIADSEGLFPGSGVDQDSIQVQVDGQNAIKDGVGQTGFIVNILSNNPANGFDISIVSEELYEPHKTINVNVTVSDFNLNVLGTNYVFTTEDLTPPVVVFISPHTNGATNVPRNVVLIIDIQSTVAVEEIDIPSLIINVNGSPAFINNSFQLGFDGLAIATTKTNLTITITKNDLFDLGESVVLDVFAADVFGNTVSSSLSFTITTQITLQSVSLPPPGIYNQGPPVVGFPSVGSFLDVTLSSNEGSASIAYTTDGSDPTIDAYFSPLGTTLIYSSPIRIINENGGIIRFFAFDIMSAEIERINNSVYFFTDCPETESWSTFALQNGLEYTLSTSLQNMNFINNVLIAGQSQKLGKADYIQDLGRECFIDSLEFDTSGTARFRVRVADTKSDLLRALWLNSLQNFVDNNLMILHDGYGPKFSTSGNNFHIEGRSQLQELFSDEATATLSQPLFESFILNMDMRLSENIDNIIGAKSFIRIKDDNYVFEIQQFISKASSVLSSQLLNQNVLFLEQPTLSINGIDAYDAYDAYAGFTDGYSGFVDLIIPPQEILDTFDFITTKVVKIDQLTQLESDLTGVFSIASVTSSVYNTFMYSDGYGDGYGDGYVYSSAQEKALTYKKIDTPTKTSFVIAVVDKPLDSATATLGSDNLNTQTDRFEPAEAGNLFTAEIFLEPGDYNFKFSVTDSSGIRICVNPYIFRTIQDLGIVQAGDILVAGGTSFTIASVSKIITDEYIIEFKKEFPASARDILTWLISRNGSILITSSQKIVVDNPLNAAIGQDASGIVANIVINSRQEVNFTYTSSTATSASVVGTFNKFDTSANPLMQILNPIEIEKAFDGDPSTAYENSYINLHKVTVVPNLPLIVDRVRFTTGVAADAYQRTRLLLDDLSVSSSDYKARKQNGQIANYSNSVDVFTSSSDGFVEWSYVQIASNKNRKLRKSIELTTRFDTYSSTSREHIEIDIFTLPGLPLLVADYFVPLGLQEVHRQNKSDFASPSNDVSVRYSRPKTLSQIPRSVEFVYDDGLIDNFLKANIIASLSSNSIYIDKTEIFSVGDNIITYDGISLLRAQIIEISADHSGLITVNSPVHSQGVIVKDYKITEDINNFIAQLEIPDFRTVFLGVISDFTPALSYTILTFEDDLNTDISAFVGGRLTYPILPRPATVLEAQAIEAVSGSQVKRFIILKIDQVLFNTNSLLGAIVEVYNSTKIVVDYLINKLDGQALCLNQSLLCDGVGTVIRYLALVPAYQIPDQMVCFNALSSDDVSIDVSSTRFSLSLQELTDVSANFFNGIDSQAPSSVTFVINDAYSVTKFLSSAEIVDGYSEALFDPLIPSTGQIVKFAALISDFGISDGYQAQRFNSLSVQFTGQPKYCIGEIEALVTTELINSRCRITLNDQELFRSPLPINNTILSRYQVQVDRGSLLVFFNGQLILTRPILFTNPIFQFGAVGKALDDLVTADFLNLSIDQFFTISPAKIEQTGRYIEIEGTVLS